MVRLSGFDLRGFDRDFDKSAFDMVYRVKKASIQAIIFIMSYIVPDCKT